MKQGFKSEHWNDSGGNPGGGCSYGTGWTISWQNGPLGRGAQRHRPNGAFVEDILDAVRERIEFYQSSQFACPENVEVLKALAEAQGWLDKRTKDREKRQVEGLQQK